MIYYYNAGVFTGKIIRLISDIRAKHGKDSVKLSDCGKFTLAEDLSDISDMTSINLSSISSLEGRCCFEECSFPTLRSAPFLGENSCMRILREFSRVARRTCRKFLEFSSPLLKSLAHSHLPYLRVNPIPIRRHPSAGILHAAEARRLHKLQENHRWVLLRGTFFLRLRPFLEKFLL